MTPEKVNYDVRWNETVARLYGPGVPDDDTQERAALEVIGREAEGDVEAPHDTAGLSLFASGLALCVCACCSAGGSWHWPHSLAGWAGLYAGAGLTLGGVVLEGLRAGWHWLSGPDTTGEDLG